MSKNEQLEINSDQERELIKQLIKNALEKKQQTEINSPSIFSQLTDYKERYNTKNVFKEGDLIKWKDNLKNRTVPDYNEPAIVVEILDEPIFNNIGEVTDTYYNEKYDIKVGIIKDKSFLFFYFDSNRFEKFEISL